MSEHKWLTEDEVRGWMTWQESKHIGFYTVGTAKRLIADRREMRELLRRAYMQIDLPVSADAGADLADEILEAWTAMEGES